MKKIAIFLSSLFLVGCAVDQKVIKSIDPTDLYESGKSSLVYRHSKPMQTESTITLGHQPGNTEASLLNSEWIKELKYRDIGIGAGEMIRAITAPKSFPFAIALTGIDPIAEIFKQGKDVEIKRLDTLGHTELEEVWMPAKAGKIVVKRGELEVLVEGK